MNNSGTGGIDNKISLRKTCNNLLDNVVNLQLSLFPELRYIQCLWSLNIIDSEDRFYEEPYDTVVRILPKIVDLINNKFPEDAKITDKLRRVNIFTCLEELCLAKKTDDFKLKTI